MIFTGKTNSMKISHNIFLTVVAGIFSAVTGCIDLGFEPSYTEIRSTGPSKNYQHSKKYFKQAKQEYLNFKFQDSITSLQKAINHETYSSDKANYYIYMGANYFYLRDLKSALGCFSMAKKHNHYIRPSLVEFPPEIIRLYNRVP